MTEPAAKKPRRHSADVVDLLPAVEKLKPSLEWGQLSDSSRVRILVQERLALGADIRRTLEEIVRAVEAGEKERAIALLDKILSQVTPPPRSGGGH